jgi:hypothetical protein
MLNLKIGDPAPEFTASTNGGGQISLADLKGQTGRAHVGSTGCVGIGTKVQTPTGLRRRQKAFRNDEFALFPSANQRILEAS